MRQDALPWLRQIPRLAIRKIRTCFVIAPYEVRETEDETKYMFAVYFVYLMWSRYLWFIN